MSDAPDRILVETEPYDFSGYSPCWVWHGIDGVEDEEGLVAYVRADIHEAERDALRAEVERLRAEVERMRREVSHHIKDAQLQMDVGKLAGATTFLYRARLALTTPNKKEPKA